MATPISEVTFVVVDTETTGVSPADGRVIEVAAIKVRNGRIEDRFSQLVNPERSVPRYITELTGITTAMLYNQPTAAEVLPRFLEFLGDGVLIGHNLLFDRRFLDAELIRLNRPILTNQGVCTVRLARRLLSGLPSKGLSSVTDFYRIKIVGRHRAAGDAEATAEVFLRFLAQLRTEYGIETLEQLLSFQFKSYSRPRQESKHVRRIREEVLPELPEAPGVYFMRNGKNTILYIGKAKDLRARVRSYFAGIEGHTPRLRQLIDKVRRITYTETDSELSALLLESKLIKQHQPQFNRAQRRYRTRPFIRLDVNEAFPRVSVSSYLLNDGAEYFGPLGGRRQAELVIEIINRFFLLRECGDNTFRRRERCFYASIERCNAPCIDADAASRYPAEVQRVRDFLSGRDSGIIDRIREAMKQSAARLEFEQAAAYRDWIERLEGMLAKQQCIAAPVLEHNAVLALPAAAPENVQLYFIRYGRFKETMVVSRDLTQGEEFEVRRRVMNHFILSQEEPARYLKTEVDEVSILAHWMYVYRNTARKVTWNSEGDLDAFMDRLRVEIERPWNGVVDQPDEEEEVMLDEE